MNEKEPHQSNQPLNVNHNIVDTTITTTATPPSQNTTALDSKKMRLKLWVVCLVMLAFGFALIPFYKAICEATGINVLSRQENNEKILNTQVDLSRIIDVQLDANVHGNFKFTPEVRYLNVHPGEIKTVYYKVVNQTDRSIRAQAIPSYAPERAAKYFSKLECFCFKEQIFKPFETKVMPVVFLINSNIDKDVHTITLSYTFFETGIANATVK